MATTKGNSCCSLGDLICREEYLHTPMSLQDLRKMSFWYELPKDVRGSYYRLLNYYFSLRTNGSWYPEIYHQCRNDEFHELLIQDSLSELRQYTYKEPIILKAMRQFCYDRLKVYEENHSMPTIIEVFAGPYAQYKRFEKWMPESEKKGCAKWYIFHYKYIFSHFSHLPCWFLMAILDELVEDLTDQEMHDFYNTLDFEDVDNVDPYIYRYTQANAHDEVWACQLPTDGVDITWYMNLMCSKCKIKRPLGIDKKEVKKIHKEFIRTGMWRFDQAFNGQYYDRYDNIAQKIVRMQYQSDVDDNTPIYALAVSTGEAIKETFMKRIAPELSGLHTLLETINWCMMGMSICQLLLFVADFIVNGWSAIRFINMGLTLFGIISSIMLAVKIKQANDMDILNFVNQSVTALLEAQFNGTDTNPPEAEYESPTSSFSSLNTEHDVEILSEDVAKELYQEALQLNNARKQAVVLPNETIFKFHRREEEEIQAECSRSRAQRHKGQRIFNQLQVEYTRDQGISMDSCIKLICGTVSVGIAIASQFSGSTRLFQRDFIASHKFSDAVLASTDSIKGMVATIAQECFNYNMYGYDRIVADIKKTLDELAEFHARPNIDFSSDNTLYYKYRDLIDHAENTCRDLHRPFGQLPTNVTTMVTSLASAISVARSHIAVVKRTTVDSEDRQETVIVQIVGEHGAGKTHLTTQYIIPKLCKHFGWDSKVYAINFCNQEYWQPYRGQPVALFDEFLATAEKDPILKSINLIGSTAAFNMAGAELHDKVQPCRFKVLFLISNRHHVNLKNEMTPEAMAATYSRFMRFEVINKDQVSGMAREKVPRKEDHSNLEIRSFDGPPTSLSTLPSRIENDPFKVIEPYQMYEQIKERICDKQKAFIAMMERKANITKDQSDGAKHQVYLFHGLAGRGKTEAARRVARRLSRLMQMDIFDITNQDFRDFTHEPKRGIYVIHDRLTDQQAYSNFYDAIPAPSIILLTANIEIVQSSYMRTFSSYRRMEDPTLIGTFSQYLQQAYYSWKNRPLEVRMYRNENIEQGFIRRIGICGPLCHDGQLSYRSYDEGGTIHCVEGFRMLFSGKDLDNQIVHGKSVYDTDIVDIIFDRYRKYLAQVCGLRMVRSSERITDVKYPLSSCDVKVVCDSKDDLFKMCSSVQNIIQAWFNGRNINPQKPYVQISRRTEQSTYNFDPRAFFLDKTTDIQQIITMAQRTYSTLRDADADHSVYIEANEFQAYAKDGIITWYHCAPDEKFEWKEWSMSDDKTMICIKDYVRLATEQEGRIESEKYYITKDVIYGLVNGFHHVSTVDRSNCEYLSSKRNEILNMKEHKIMVEQAKVAAISMAGKKDAIDKFRADWANWIDFSPWYKVAIIFAGIAVVISVVFSIIGLVRWAMKSYNTTKRKFNNSNDRDHFILKGDEIDYDGDGEIREVIFSRISPGLNEFSAVCYMQQGTLSENANMSVITDMLYKRIQLKFEEVADNSQYWISNFDVISEQSTYSREYKAKGQRKSRGKKEAVKSTWARTTPVTHDQSMFDNTNWTNPDIAAIRKKVAYNMCKIITYSRGMRTFALRVKDRFILSPAHIWSYVGDQGYVEVKESDGNSIYTNSYQVQCVLINRDYDVAVVYCHDTRMRNCADITGYFHDRNNSGKIMSGVLLKLDSIKAISDDNWYQTPFMHFPGTIQRVVAPASRSGNPKLHAYKFERFSGLHIPTVAGDCGQPYFALQKSFGSKVLLGMHISRSELHNSTEISALDEQLVRTMLDEAKLTIDAAGGVLPAVAIQSELQSEAPTVKIICDQRITKLEIPKLPGQMELAERVVCGDYADWINALEPISHEETSNVFYNEKNLDSKLFLVGYDPNHVPSDLGKPSHTLCPWSKDISLPNEAHLSVVNYRQLPVERIIQLPKIKGRPSVLLEQVSFYNDPCKWGSVQESLLQQAEAYIQQKYDVWYAGKHRVLTELEAINGFYVNPRCEWYGYLQGLDLNSSAGDFPRRLGITQKKGLFVPLDPETDQRILYTWGSNERQSAVYRRRLAMEELAKSGMHLVTPMQDNLKRELVKKDKARCFQSLTAEATVLIRKYTGTIQAAVTKNHDKAYCQVGIDPLVGFHRLYKRFSNVSLIGEAGDFKRYDKHLLAIMIYRIMMIFKNVWKKHARHFDDDSIDNLWDVFADMIINSLCVVDGVVYVKIKGNPSGNPLTTIINSGVNDLKQVMFVIYRSKFFLIDIKIHPQNYLCAELIRCRNMTLKALVTLILSQMDGGTYGDDCIWVWNIIWKELLGFDHKRAFLKEYLGIDYDTPDKDNTVYSSKSLEDLQFLSRQFKCERNIVFPRLKQFTINSFFHWASEITSEQLTQLMRDAFTEAVLHDEQYYASCLDAYHIIAEYFRVRGMPLQFVPDIYKQARHNVELMILHGRDVAHSFPETVQEVMNCKSGRSAYLSDLLCVYKEDLNSENPELEKVFYYDQGDMDPYTICSKLAAGFGTQSYCNMKVIKNYRPFPAMVKTEASTYFSVVFDVLPGSQDNFAGLQSDVVKIINKVTFDDINVTFLKSTFVYRKIDQQEKLVCAAQVHLHIDPKGESHRWATDQVTTLTLTKQLNKKLQLQASGTAEVPTITQSGTGEGGNGILLPIQDNHVAPIALEASLWHYDVKELAHRKMESINSPVELAVGTPAGTIIYKASLGEMNAMSPAMRIWGGVNSVTCATQMVTFELVTAATIVNSYRVGIVATKKATYTPQELQLIKWYDLSPQDTIFTAPLRLAAVDSTQNIPNRYVLVEEHANGTAVPTIVLMTRTAIQNSYQNDAININFKVYMWWQNETGGPSAWRATAEDLAKGFPAGSVQARTRSGDTLSSILRLPPGRPFHAVADGGKSHRAVVKQWRSLDEPDPVWRELEINNLTNTLVWDQPDVVAVCGVHYQVRADAISDTLSVPSAWYQYLGLGQEGTPIPLANFSWRRLLNWPATANAIILPVMNNVKIPVDSNTTTSGNRYDSITTIASNNYNNQPGTTKTVTAIMTDLRNSELINSKHYWLFYTHNGCPLPCINFAFEQRYALNDMSSDLAYDEFMDQWRIVLERQNWDMVETVMEFTGLQCETRRQMCIGRSDYVNNGITSGDAGWSSFVINFNTLASDFYRVDGQPTGTYFSSGFIPWVEPEKRLIKLFHPTLGTIYVIALLKSPEGDDLIPVHQPNWCEMTSCSFDGVATKSYISEGTGQDCMHIRGTMNTRVRVLNMLPLEDTITRVERLTVMGFMTLAPQQSRFVFSPSLPSTLTETMAQSDVGTEMNDPLFHALIHQWFLNQGVAEDGVVRFQLSNRQNTYVFAVVTYDMKYRFFSILNNPRSQSDRYKVYPKLTYEDVVLFNLETITGNNPSSLTTSTDNWPTRVVPDSSGALYNGHYVGAAIADIGTRIRRKNALQAEEAIMALAGAGGGFAQAIMQYLMQSRQFKMMSQFQQQQFYNDLKLLEQKYTGEQGLIEKRADVNSLQSGVAQQQAAAGNAWAPSIPITTPAVKSYVDKFIDFQKAKDTSASDVSPPVVEISAGQSTDTATPSTSGSNAPITPVESVPLATEATERNVQPEVTTIPKSLTFYNRIIGSRSTPQKNVVV